MLAYATDWPASFWITTLSGAVYLLAILGHTLPIRRSAITASAR